MIKVGDKVVLQDRDLDGKTINGILLFKGMLDDIRETDNLQVEDISKNDYKGKKHTYAKLNIGYIVPVTILDVVKDDKKDKDTKKETKSKEELKKEIDELLELYLNLID